MIEPNWTSLGLSADSVAPKESQSEWEAIDHCIQGAVVSVAFAQAHDVLIRI